MEPAAVAVRRIQDVPTKRRGALRRGHDDAAGVVNLVPIGWPEC